MSAPQLVQDGLSGPHGLAGKSGLDRICEVALELNALRRQQNRVVAVAGLENAYPNLFEGTHHWQARRTS